MNPLSYSRCFHRAYANNSCSKYIRRRDNGLSHPGKATESLQTATLRHHPLSSGTSYPPASKSVNPQSDMNHRSFTGGGGGRLSQHIQQAIRETSKRKDDENKQTTKPTSPKTVATSPLPRSSNNMNTKNLRDKPRKIQVKPAPSSNDAKPRQGTIVNRFALNRELQDSQGTTIWLPSPQEQRHYPTIRAMAVLDPVTYLKTKSRSVVGPEAARRLLYGKRDVVMILRCAAQRGLRVQLHGHGVPRQLWSYVLDAAVEDWMSAAPSEGEMVVEEVEADMVRWSFRNDATGDVTEAVKHFSYELELYWRVMRRIASRLGPLVLFRPRQSGVPKRCQASFNRQEPVNEELGHQISMEWNMDDTSMTIILEGRGAVLRFTATFSLSSPSQVGDDLFDRQNEL